MCRFKKSPECRLARRVPICEEKGVHVSGDAKGANVSCADGSQTPTLNARPIVRAIKQTCRRGVDVVLLLDLGG